VDCLQGHWMTVISLLIRYETKTGQIARREHDILLIKLDLGQKNNYHKKVIFVPIRFNNGRYDKKIYNVNC
jgi:hypothetical protein